MRYDPEDIQYYFNEEMTLSAAGEAALDNQLKKYRNEALKKPYKMYGIKEDQTGDKIRIAIGSLWFIASVLVLLYSVPMKRYDISGWVVVGFLVVIGLLMLFTPEKKASRYFSESAASQRVQGAVLVIGGIVSIFLQLKYNEMDTMTFLMKKWFVISIVAAVAMTVKVIGYLMAEKSVYKEEIEATCIGYVRTKEGSGDEIPHTVCSPVFEYHHDGEKIQAFYDVLETNKDGKIPVGSTIRIKIDPDHPEKVMGDHKRLITTPAVFVLIGVIAAAALGYFLYK